MKYIRFLGILLPLVVNTAVLHAQGFAGPDKSELVRMGDSATITLGNGSGGSGYCYTWFVLEDLLVGNSDVHQPTITIRLGEGEYNFRVMRLSLCDGKEEDEVHVVVRSTIHLVSASPKYACYNEGDYIFNEQFDIVTDPVGYGYLANVQPAVAQITTEEGNNQTVTFSLTHNGVTTYASCQIYVVDPTIEVPSNLSVNLLGTMTALYFLTDNAEALLRSVSAPCQLTTTGSLNAPFKRERHLIRCCRDHTPYEVVEISEGGFSIGVSTTCRFPLPFATIGIPGIPKASLASLDAVLKLSGNFTRNPVVGVYSPYEECGEDVCCSGSVSFSVEGGIGASLLSGVIASADLTIGGGGEVAFSKCVNKPYTPPRLSIEAYFAGNITVASFVSMGFKKVFYRKSILVNL